MVPFGMSLRWLEPCLFPFALWPTRYLFPLEFLGLLQITSQFSSPDLNLPSESEERCVIVQELKNEVLSLAPTVTDLQFLISEYETARLGNSNAEFSELLGCLESFCSPLKEAVNRR